MSRLLNLCWKYMDKLSNSVVWKKGTSVEWNGVMVLRLFHMYWSGLYWKSGEIGSSRRKWFNFGKQKKQTFRYAICPSDSWSWLQEALWSVNPCFWLLPCDTLIHLWYGHQTLLWLKCQSPLIKTLFVMFREFVVILPITTQKCTVC